MGHETRISDAAKLAGLFDATQTQTLNELLPTLSPEQSLWLSGFLAGCAREAPAVETAAEAQGEAAPRVTLLYATETGNAAGVAKQAAETLTRAGLDARAVDMADYKQRDLKSETHVLLVSATHGEGDPPDPAAGFFEFLWGRKAPKLAGVKFAVLGLGDTSYVHFCQAAKDLDARFEELGGERIAERVDCDVDYDDAAEAWIAALTDKVKAEAPSTAATAANARSAARLTALGLGAEAGAAEVPAYSRKTPYSAEILESIRLNGRYSDKETQHLELSLDGSGLGYTPGDSIGVIPENDPALVEEVLTALDLPESAPVANGGGGKLLGEALRGELELTTLTPGFLRAYADASEAEELRALVEGESEALQGFLREHQVADVVARWPVRGLDPSGFAAMLRKLQPRLYSIASSQKAVPDEVHLTVAVTRATPAGRARDGVASTHLAARRAPGDTLDVYVHANEGFRLPDDPTRPILMIGPGTGVAPFRAFLQEREETAATGKSWLFFGERRFREDFLYQTDWQRWLKSGVLSRMDVAFSRDQADRIYVQDRLRERAREVYAWIMEGAHLYLCGDAEAMAAAVHAALIDVLKQEGGYTAENAEDHLRTMRQERRYQRDVY